MPERKKHDWSVPPLSRAERERWMLRFIEPPAKHPNRAAVWSYYTGWASLIPGIGLMLGPLALVFGMSGLVGALLEPGRPGLRHASLGACFGVLTTALNTTLFLVIVPVFVG